MTGFWNTRYSSSAADRICAAESHLYRAQQTKTVAAGRNEKRHGLGRSADADPRRIRRRGYTPEAIRGFCERIGVAKRNSTVDIAMLEHAVREDLNKRAPRVLAVLRPIRWSSRIIPKAKVEQLEAVNNPEDAAMGTRQVPFSRVLYIEQDDFREDPPKGFFRLSRVRRCGCAMPTSSNATRSSRIRRGGNVELRCTYDPETRAAGAPDNRKVKATIHWVSAAHAVPARGQALRSSFQQRRSR